MLKFNAVCAIIDIPIYGIGSRMSESDDNQVAVEERIHMARYEYAANIMKGDGDNTDHLIEFPQFGIRGRGFPGYDDTLSFAADMLAEIILDFEKRGRKLPDPKGEVSDGLDAPGAHREIVAVDTDRYLARIARNERRVFHELEATDDSRRPEETPRVSLLENMKKKFL